MSVKLGCQAVFFLGGGGGGGGLSFTFQTSVVFFSEKKK